MTPEVVLMVEDDHDTRVAIRQTLEEHGYLVVSVTNGGDALDALKKIKTCAVVLLDWMLPFMNGNEFVNAKNADPALASIPVIVISAHRRDISGPGISTFLPKPLDVEALLKAMKQYSNHSTDEPIAVLG